MRFASLTTLLLATALASPALWHAIVTRDLDPRTALLRYLIAVPIAAIMLAVIRGLTSGYQHTKRAPLRVTAVAGEPMQRNTDADTP